MKVPSIFRLRIRLRASTKLRMLHSSRNFSASFRSLQKGSGTSVLPEAPDWSPTAPENDTWLDQVGHSNVKMDVSDVYSKDERFADVESSLEDQSYDQDENGQNMYNSGPFSGILSTGKIRYKFSGYDESKLLKLQVPLDQFSALRTSPYSRLSSKQRPKSTSSNQNFSDLRIINLKSGKGGNGCVSFFRDAGRAIGPPDGGDGGDGGSIYVQAVEGINSLHKLRVKYAATDGLNGAARQLDGARGQDVVITVPVGTTIKWIPPTDVLKQAEEDAALQEEGFEDEEDTPKPLTDIEIKGIGAGPKHVDYVQMFRYDEANPVKDDNWIFKEKDRDYHYDKSWFNDLNRKVKKYDKNMLNEELSDDIIPFNGVDLSKPTKTPVLLLKGGKGGLGNMHFLTKEIRNPRFCKRGRSGLEANFLFELKMLADFGLVGLPNSGKSTLLNAISNANSKVGHWEFTTLQPTIGTILPQGQIHLENFTVADIPGIIKGAATCVEKPKGMGVDFLRHIERSKILVMLVSLENDPIHDFNILINELKFGKDRLKNKNVLIVNTKADLTKNGDKFKGFKSYIRENFQENCQIIPICALKKQNVNKLIAVMNGLVQKHS